jgi:hypothetical protein
MEIFEEKKAGVSECVGRQMGALVVEIEPYDRPIGRPGFGNEYEHREQINERCISKGPSGGPGS